MEEGRRKVKGIEEERSSGEIGGKERKLRRKGAEEGKEEKKNIGKECAIKSLNI